MLRVVIPILVLQHLSSTAQSFGSCNSVAGLTAFKSALCSTKDNNAMSFLRRKGLVGGNKDFTSAIGIDEGPAGKNGPSGKPFRKASNSYKSCVESGIIDDFSEEFPMTSSGTEWSGFSDRVMGGVSIGSLMREHVHERVANVLRGEVSLANNGGFIQMAVDLSNDPSASRVVDASRYDGIELDVLCRGDTQIEDFNVHTFKLNTNAGWETVRVPWTSFRGKGPGAVDVAFDPSRLRRIGVVAIGREMKVDVAVSKLAFYTVV